MSDIDDQDYCGCCGNECPEGELWCGPCSWHVLDNMFNIWDRTWFAQYGTDCPEQAQP